MSPNNLSGRKKSVLFFELSKEKFNYLIAEYNFSLVSTRKDGGLYEIVFQNKTTAVIVNWERHENWIYIELYRLVNGMLVTNPIIISDQTELNGYHLDDLLSIRCPDFSLTKFPVDDKDIVAILKNYSAMLHQYATDVLNGDFTIFGDLEKIVKGRIASSK